MQAKVPKFIDIEDKVIFGLTWRQFFFLGVGSGAGVLAFSVLVQPLGTTVAVVTTAIGAVFAFVKINNRPMHVFMYSLWNYFFNPRRFVWQKEEPRRQKTKVMKKEAPKAAPKAVTAERLKQLAVLLDIKGRKSSDTNV